MSGPPNPHEAQSAHQTKPPPHFGIATLVAGLYTCHPPDALLCRVPAWDGREGGQYEGRCWQPQRRGWATLGSFARRICEQDRAGCGSRATRRGSAPSRSVPLPTGAAAAHCGRAAPDCRKKAGRLDCWAPVPPSSGGSGGGAGESAAAQAAKPSQAWPRQSQQARGGDPGSGRGGNAGRFEASGAPCLIGGNL
jgi:hypothetical protein